MERAAGERRLLGDTMRMIADLDPLILTAAFDPITAEIFDGLRKKHFPPKLNIVPAHLTIFHKLPGSESAAVTARLHEMCEIESKMAFEVDGLRFLGRGVALAIAAPRLALLRQDLADGWRTWLTAQDGQPFQPHVTLQNKANPTEARKLHSWLEAAPPAITGTIVGFDLWHYRGGPWEQLGRFSFRKTI